jgi:hypothetical protein
MLGVEFGVAGGQAPQQPPQPVPPQFLNLLPHTLALVHAKNG